MSTCPSVRPIFARAILAGSIAAAFMQPGASFAQSASASDGSPPAPPQLEPVRVVGQRDPAPSVGEFTGASLQDTPKTVSVYNRATLDDIQARSIEDVVKLDPAVRPTSPYGLFGQQYNIRGINIGAYAYTRDGLTTRWALEPIDQLEKIEVLKGVSGLEYGANANPGGGINFVPKMPTAKNMTSIEGRVDAFGGFYEHLDLSRRFGADGAGGIRINIARDDIRYAASEPKGDRTLGALALEYRFSGSTVASVNGYVYRAGIDHSSSGYYGLTSAGGLPPIGYKDWFGQGWAEDRYESAVIEPKLVTEIAGWKFSAKAHVYWLYTKRQDAYTNSDLSTGAYTTVTYENSSSTDRIIDARVQLDRDFRFGDIGHHLSLRVDRSGNNQRGASNSTDVAQTGNTHAGTEFPDIGLPFLPRGLWYRYVLSGVAVNDRLSFGDQWDLNLGFRQSRIYQEGTDGAPDYEVDNFSPAVSVVYKPTKQLSLYAGFAEAIEPTGTAPDTVDLGNGPVPVKNARSSLAPALARQIEVGAKYAIGEDLLATFSLFDLTRPNSYVNSDLYYVLGGDAKYKGAELGLSGNLTSNLKLVGGIAYIHGKIVDPSNPSAGDQVPVDSAKWAGSLFALYELGYGFTVSGGVNAVGARPLFSDNSLSVPGYATVDLGASYTRKFDEHVLTLRLGIDNVADKFYWASSSYGSPAIGQPRTVKLSAKYDF